MPKTTAGVADFHHLLVEEASIFRSAVVHVVRNFGTFEDDNTRTRLSHSCVLENHRVLRVDQTLCDVFLRVAVGDVENHAFQCVIGWRHIRGRNVGLVLDLNYFDVTILLDVFYCWPTHDHDVPSRVEAKDTMAVRNTPAGRHA